MAAVEREKYRGQYAAGYEEHRQGRPLWNLEQREVPRFIRLGPVLDVPCGTGRFFRDYERLGLRYVGLDLSEDMLEQARARCRLGRVSQGDALTHPLVREGFGTAVCVRFLNWLNPDELAMFLPRLLESAREVVATARLGPKLSPGKDSFRHSYDQIYAAAASAGCWVDRLVQLEESSGTWLFRLRPPVLQDVLEQFRWNKLSLSVLARMWFRRFDVEVPDTLMSDFRVRCEYWSGHRLETEALGVLRHLKTREGESAAARPPKDSSRPMTMIRINGNLGILDGLHRLQHFRGRPVTVPVFILEGPWS